MSINVKFCKQKKRQMRRNDINLRTTLIRPTLIFFQTIAGTSLNFFTITIVHYSLYRDLYSIGTLDIFISCNFGTTQSDTRMMTNAVDAARGNKA